MNYRNFDRHQNMSQQTLAQISKVIRELMLQDAPTSLINKTYGLYDGYHYDGLEQELKGFFKWKGYEIAIRIADIFAKVNRYPELTYGDEAPEEVRRMMASINL